MKIQSINIYQQKNNTTRKNVYSNPISFSGIKLSKSLISGFEKQSEIIGKAKKEITDTFDASIKGLTDIDDVFTTIDKTANEQIQNIKENYFFTKKRVNAVLDSSNQSKNNALLQAANELEDLSATARVNLDTAKKLPEKLKEHDKSTAFKRHDMIKQQYPAGSIVGFDRISGYQDVKDTLEKAFFTRLDAEKAGKDVQIPGLFLFFGPTGTGKSTFAQAVAQETGCRFVKIELNFKCSDSDKLAFMEKLNKEKIKAEEVFAKTKQRTIFYVDEYTKVISKNSIIAKEFNEFAKTCSEKYHCTIFGGTNRMGDIGIDIKALDPVIIAIEPADKKTASLIFKHYLKGKEDGKIDYELLADTLIKTGKERGGTYSNTQIRYITKNSAKENKNGISQADILDTIKNKMQGVERPAIDDELQGIFKKDYDKFILGIEKKA